MKTLKKTFVVIILFMASISWPMISSSQEWSQEQKEVLEFLQKQREYWANRDLDGYMSCIHEDFIGWYQNSPLPQDKNSLQYWESNSLSTSKILRQNGTPVTINIIGDIAIVFSYASSIREDVNGTNLRHSKWTHICKRENGQWLIIGTSGGRLPNN